MSKACEEKKQPMTSLIIRPSTSQEKVVVQFDGAPPDDEVWSALVDSFENAICVESNILGEPVERMSGRYSIGEGNPLRTKPIVVLRAIVRWLSMDSVHYALGTKELLITMDDDILVDDGANSVQEKEFIRQMCNLETVIQKRASQCRSTH
jgi:hypothetical protein